MSSLILSTFHRRISELFLKAFFHKNAKKRGKYFENYLLVVLWQCGMQMQYRFSEFLLNSLKK